MLHPTIVRRAAVLRLALSLPLCWTLFTAAAALSAADGLTLLQEIHNGADGVEIKDHVTSAIPYGDYVHFGICYQGLIKTFQRGDDGKLTFVRDTVWGKQHDSIDLCRIGNRLYGVGGAGHRTGDGDSRGIHWWQIDEKTGTLTEQGKLDVPISSGIVPAPDGKSFYVLYSKKETVAHYTVGDDGTPRHADDAHFTEAKGGVTAMTLTPDGKSIYVLWAGDTYFVGHAAVGAGGALTIQAATELPQLTRESTHARNKWGWGWGRGIFVSPDSQFVYVEFCNYQGKERHIGVCARDLKTGAIEYKTRTDATTGPTMVRLDVAFEADGKKGYYLSSSESSGDIVGWFTRDPATGIITVGGQVKDTRKSGPCCLTLDAKTKTLYVGTWSRKNIYVLKTE